MKDYPVTDEKKYQDGNGNQLFSVRREKVTPYHLRRYYNDILVYEGIQASNETRKSLSIRYYYPSGTLQLEFREEHWYYYDESGQLIYDISDTREQMFIEDDCFDLFLPTWEHYNDVDNIIPDWEIVKKCFIKAYEQTMLDIKIFEATIPDVVKVELDKMDWYNNELSFLINGILSDEDIVADISLKTLWKRAGYSNDLYSVGIVLARILPHYPMAGHQINKFLYNVLLTEDITDETALYEELIEAIQPSLATIFRYAEEFDAGIYILTHVGRDSDETIAFLQGLWQQSTYSSKKKAFAIFALSVLLPSKTLLTDAFQTETDPLLRIVLALQLVEDTPADEYIAVLVDAFTLNADYDSLYPLIRGDMRTEILKTIYNSDPALLEKHIEMVITALPSASPVEQTVLLGAIFTALFPEDEALEDITPIRKKALLAVAEIINPHINYVNHGEVFREYNIPYNKQALIEKAMS